MMDSVLCFLRMLNLKKKMDKGYVNFFFGSIGFVIYLIECI